MLRAAGFEDADFTKPIVGVVLTARLRLAIWELHHWQLKQKHSGSGWNASIVRDDHDQRNFDGYRRNNTVSRDVLLTRSTVCNAQSMDGVAIGGCDKICPVP